MRHSADAEKLSADLCEQSVLIAVGIERQERLSAEPEATSIALCLLGQQDASHTADCEIPLFLRREGDSAVILKFQKERLLRDGEGAHEAFEPIGLLLFPDRQLRIIGITVKGGEERGAVRDRELQPALDRLIECDRIVA